jgi:signal transduction histidine kinase
MVRKRTKEIEQKNAILLKQTNELSEINTIMEERQQRIEEQAEELRSQAEALSNTNQTLITLNATKDKFFSIIAHDLKNPFSSILGFCEVLSLRYDKYDDTKRKHLIGVIERSAQNVFRLLENLLQWSRSQTGTIKFTPEEFEIREIIENISSLVYNSLEEKGLKLTYTIPENLKVYADKNMIHTVIRNLVTNSIKFSENSEIAIDVLDHGPFIKVIVSDGGVGIRKDMINKIFEVEKSKSTEGTRGESGTGLGLIICKEFVEKNGGNIGVESEFGKGSVFYFTLPKNDKINILK